MQAEWDVACFRAADNGVNAGTVVDLWSREALQRTLEQTVEMYSLEVEENNRFERGSDIQESSPLRQYRGYWRYPRDIFFFKCKYSENNAPLWKQVA